jgi:hypothetical protein
MHFERIRYKLYCVHNDVTCSNPIMVRLGYGSKIREPLSKAKNTSDNVQSNPYMYRNSWTLISQNFLPLVGLTEYKAG